MKESSETMMGSAIFGVYGKYMKCLGRNLVQIMRSIVHHQNLDATEILVRRVLK